MLGYLTKIRGPDFSQLETVRYDLSGSKVEFKAPLYNYSVIEKEERLDLFKTFNLYDSSLYWSETEVREEDEQFDPENDVDGFSLFKSVWSFKAPIIDFKKASKCRNEGSLQLHIKVRQFMPQFNLFAPEYFEKAIDCLIESTFGPDSHFGGVGMGGRRFVAPLRWTLHKVRNIDWVSFFVERIGHENCGQYFWIAPLTQQHAICFCFRITGAPSHRLFAVYEEFMYQIVSTCKIERSSTVESQIAAVSEELKQYPISKKRVPFKWAEYDQNPEKYRLPT